MRKKVHLPRVAYCWGANHTYWSPERKCLVSVVEVIRNRQGVVIGVRHTEDGDVEEVR